MTPTRRVTTSRGIVAVRNPATDSWTFSTGRMSWHWFEHTGSLYWCHQSLGTARLAAEAVRSIDQAATFADGWDAGAMWWQDGGRDLAEIGGAE